MSLSLNRYINNGPPRENWKVDMTRFCFQHCLMPSTHHSGNCQGISPEDTVGHLISQWFSVWVNDSHTIKDTFGLNVSDQKHIKHMMFRSSFLGSYNDFDGLLSGKESVPKTASKHGDITSNSKCTSTTFMEYYLQGW